MSLQLLAPDAKPCVWMCAGLIRYRLCDRDFDCEGCPLDAALRADARAPSPHEAHTTALPPAGAVPADRCYSGGHTWVRPLPEEPGVCRLGLDAFAAAILGNAIEVRCNQADRRLERGDLICDLDLGLGTLSLGAPVRGRLLRGNPRLCERPDEVLSEPYEEGWIAEMADVDCSELDHLCRAEEARERTAADLARFRRDVAMRLFVGAGAAEGWNGHGPRLTDLRQMLGRAGYLELVAEFVH